MPREMKIKSSLKAKDLMNPNSISAQADTVREVIAGQIWGIIQDTVVRTMPDDKTYVGFRGAFRMMPHDEAKPMLQSGIIFFPDFVRDPLMQHLEELKKETKGVLPNLKVGYLVKVERAENKQGYTWTYTPIYHEAQADPLQSFIETANSPALAGPDQNDNATVVEQPAEHKKRASAK